MADGTDWAISAAKAQSLRRWPGRSMRSSQRNKLNSGPRVRSAANASRPAIPVDGTGTARPRVNLHLRARTLRQIPVPIEGLAPAFVRWPVSRYFQ